MKISSITIENFRSFKHQTIECGDYNCFVGPNGAGKSNVLNALNVFFREMESSPVDLVNLSEEDFYKKDTTKPIRITVTFTDLNEEAKVDLKDYVRQDKLVVSAIAEWDPNTATANVLQRGQRAAMKQFVPFFDAVKEGKVVSELKDIYKEIQTQVPELGPPTTKAAMIQTLQGYEEVHPEKCGLIESDDQFYGISRGVNRLAKYIQWVFVPAVKDAVSEQAETKETALGRILQRTVRAKINFAERIKQLRMEAEKGYDALLAENQEALDGVSNSLRQKLAQWAHPGASLSLKWNKDPNKSVRIEEPFAKMIAGEGQFQGELARFGHGLQRSYLLALLQELAGGEEANAPRLLLAIEEPELFQHPPQEQHLAEVLRKLSEGNTQVFACTHSPHFVSGKGFEDVRLVRKPNGGTASVVSRATFDAVAKKISEVTGNQPYQTTGITAKIHQVLQPVLKEMFFCPVLVLVEGLEDIAYITAGLHLIKNNAGQPLWEEWRQLGGHLVAVNGKSEFLQPLAIAQIMEIPTFIVFDADGDVVQKLQNTDRQTDPKGYQKLDTQQSQHKADNQRILKLLGQASNDVFPTHISWQDTFVVWPANIGKSVQADFEPADWERWRRKVQGSYGGIGDLDKNTIFIGDLLSEAWRESKSSPTLTELCQRLITFARK